MLDVMAHPLSQIHIMHRLKKVGFTQEQAEEQAQIVTEVHENNLATKQDVKSLETKTNSEFALLRMEIKKDFESLKVDLTVRMTIMMASLLALFSAIQKFLIN